MLYKRKRLRQMGSGRGEQRKDRCSVACRDVLWHGNHASRPDRMSHGWVKAVLDKLRNRAAVSAHVQAAGGHVLVQQAAARQVISLSVKAEGSHSAPETVVDLAK